MRKRIKRLEHIIPLCLSGEAFTRYQQLSKEVNSNITEIKTLSRITFATDKYMVYEQFMAHHLYYGESVDVYPASSRMDMVNVSQLLARARAVMKNEMITEEPVTAATHAIEMDVPIPFTRGPTSISCYK